MSAHIRNHNRQAFWLGYGWAIPEKDNLAKKSRHRDVWALDLSRIDAEHGLLLSRSWPSNEIIESYIERKIVEDTGKDLESPSQIDMFYVKPIEESFVKLIAKITDGVSINSFPLDEPVNPLRSDKFSQKKELKLFTMTDLEQQNLKNYIALHLSRLPQHILSANFRARWAFRRSDLLEIADSNNVENVFPQDIMDSVRITFLAHKAHPTDATQRACVDFYCASFMNKNYHVERTKTKKWSIFLVCNDYRNVSSPLSFATYSMVSENQKFKKWAARFNLSKSFDFIFGPLTANVSVVISNESDEYMLSELIDLISINQLIEQIDCDHLGHVIASSREDLMRFYRNMKACAPNNNNGLFP